MNIEQNEALAYAQSTRGVSFVYINFVDRFGDPEMDAKYKKLKSTKTPARGHYAYKTPPHLHVKEGTLVVVQVLNGFYGIGEVYEVMQEPPSSADYDFKYPMKWVVGVVDEGLSDQLTKHDRKSLKAISRATLQSKVNEINRALGFDISQTIPALPGNWSEEVHGTVEETGEATPKDRPVEFDQESLIEDDYEDPRPSPSVTG